MAVKSVGIRLFGDDASLREKLDASEVKLTKLREVAGGIKLGVDDKDAQLKVGRLQLRMDKLSKTIASPRVTVEGAKRAELDLLGVEVALDRINAKSATASVGIRSHGLLSALSSTRARSALKSPFSGNAIKGLLTGTEGEMGSLASILASPAGVGLAGAALSMIPALLGGALGLGVAGGGAFGALALGSHEHQTLLALQAKLPTGHTHADNIRRRQVQAEISAYERQHAATLGAYSGFTGLGHTAASVFTGALTSNAYASKRMANGMVASVPVQGTSFMSSLTGVFSQLNGFVKSIGPDLAQMFRAASPALHQFLGGLLPMVRQVFPELTATLNALTRSGALKELGKSFGELLLGAVKALSGMSKAFHNAAQVTYSVSRFIGHAITLIGRVLGSVINLVDKLIHRRWRAAWDDARAIFHSVAVFMHDEFGHLIHNAAHAFDTIRHSIATALRGLPADMFRAGKAILQGLLHGLESEGQGVLNFIGGLGGSIISGIKGKLGIHSPSRVMLEIGRYVGQGLSLGIDASSTLVSASTARMASLVSSGMAGGRSAAYGGPGAVQPLRIEFAGGAESEFEAFMVEALRRWTRITAGGDVQAMFGHA